jgi:hypothetical protein
MRKLSIGLLMILLVLVMAIAPATAQDMTGFHFCGDLATEDCDLLMASQEAMQELHSASVNLDMGFDIRGIPDMPFEKLVFGLTANGAAAVDPALMDMMQSMQADPMQFADPQASMDMLSQLVTGVSGDFTISVSLPPDLVAMAGPDAGIPATLTFDLRMVDGVIYINLDKIAAAMPDADVPPGWMGVDLSSLLSPAGDMSGSMGSSSTLDQEAMSTYMESLMDPETMTQFLTVERIADDEIMGQTVAVFETSFDLAAFIQSDVYQNFLNAQMAAVGGDDFSSQDQAEIDQAMSMVTDAMQGLTFKQTTAIGLDDHYLHRNTMHFDWDMSDFLNMVEPDSDASEAVITFDMTMDWSDFNGDVSVAVPEDAMLIPLGGMLPSAGAF